jgi:serine/threonine-protein kinase RsbW
MIQSKSFPASLDFLHDMLYFVKYFCLKKGFSPSSINKIVLGIEEAIVNIIRHGYLNQLSGNIEIVCQECNHKPGISILIKDWGISFNPLEKISRMNKEKPSFSCQEEIGGYGIFLYLGVMDTVEYKREGDVNLLYLVKYLD